MRLKLFKKIRSIFTLQPYKQWIEKKIKSYSEKSENKSIKNRYQNNGYLNGLDTGIYYNKKFKNENLSYIFDDIDIDEAVSMIDDNQSLINHLPQKLLNNEKIAAKMIELNGAYICLLNDKFRNNKTLVHDACISTNIAFKYASDEIKSNKQIVKELIEKKSLVLQYANPIFLKDVELLKLSIEKGDYKIFTYMDASLFKDSNSLMNIFESIENTDSWLNVEGFIKKTVSFEKIMNLFLDNDEVSKKIKEHKVVDKDLWLREMYFYLKESEILHLISEKLEKPLKSKKVIKF
jgi:hypothetical protein